MTDTLAEVLEKLEIVVSLVANMTPGELTVYDANEGDGWPPRPLWCFKNEGYDSGDDPALQGSIHYGGKEDADAIAAAVNWLREHGPALLAGDGWLPIESAPRDGTTVIVWFKQHGALSCRWTDRDDDPSSEWAHWHVDDFKHGPFPVRGYNDGDATHWRPLPTPPKDAMTATGGAGVGA